MMKALPLLIVICALSAHGQDLLRIVNGTEERASVPAGLPVSITNAYAQQLYAAGYRPVVTIGHPDAVNTIEDPFGKVFTRAVRTLVETNGVWREEWIRCPMPVALDPARLCNAVLALPGGTNLLAAAMAQPAVAEWFVSSPVYVRGSDLALGMQQLLGVPSYTNLEAIIYPCARKEDE